MSFALWSHGLFRRGPREEGQPKALALSSFSTSAFLGLVFFGISPIIAGNRKTWVELCEAVAPGKRAGQKPWLQKHFHLFSFWDLCFLGYRLSTLVKERHKLSFVKLWVFRSGPREEERPKALALRAFSCVIFLGLVFFGISSINAGKRNTLVSALAPRAFSSFVFLGLVSFTSVDIVYQHW
jgi:hypothetical protein